MWRFWGVRRSLRGAMLAWNWCGTSEGGKTHLTTVVVRVEKAAARQPSRLRRIGPLPDPDCCSCCVLRPHHRQAFFFQSRIPSSPSPALCITLPLSLFLLGSVRFPNNRPLVLRAGVTDRTSFSSPTQYTILQCTKRFNNTLHSPPPLLVCLTSQLLLVVFGAY